MKQMKNREDKLEDFQSSSCIPQEKVIKNVRLAAAYVPYQIFCTIFTPLEALKKGTCFPELHSPYEGKDKEISQLEAVKRRGYYERCNG